MQKYEKRRQRRPSDIERKFAVDLTKSKRSISRREIPQRRFGQC
jgi:hypothetical protein